MRFIIKPFTIWQDLTPLIIESEQEGFRFLRRLEQDWLNNTNSFKQHGETFLVVYKQGHIIAVGGVNRETEYAGRLRRFYVASAYRRKGVGSLLLKQLLNFAKDHYQILYLKTDTLAGHQFYQALGFLPYLTENITHKFDLAHYSEALYSPSLYGFK